MHSYEFKVTVKSRTKLDRKEMKEILLSTIWGNPPLIIEEIDVAHYRQPLVTCDVGKRQNRDKRYPGNTRTRTK